MFTPSVHFLGGMKKDLTLIYCHRKITLDFDCEGFKALEKCCEKFDETMKMAAIASAARSLVVKSFGFGGGDG